MGLSLNSFFKDKTIKLSDSYLVYITQGGEVFNTFECVGITLPKLNFKEETISYGNNTQSFFLPDYQSLDTVSIDLILYKNPSSRFLISFIENFNTTLEQQNFSFLKLNKREFINGYIKNNVHNNPQHLDKLNIYILNNNLNKVVYEYEFKDLYLVDYNLYELSYNSDTPCQISLSFAFEEYSKHDTFENAELSRFSRIETNAYVTKESDMEKLISSYNKQVSKIKPVERILRNDQIEALNNVVNNEPIPIPNELLVTEYDELNKQKEELVKKIKEVMTEDKFNSMLKLYNNEDNYQDIFRKVIGSDFSYLPSDGLLKQDKLKGLEGINISYENLTDDQLIQVYKDYEKISNDINTFIDTADENISEGLIYRLIYEEGLSSNDLDDENSTLVSELYELRNNIGEQNFISFFDKLKGDENILSTDIKSFENSKNTLDHDMNVLKINKDDIFNSISHVLIQSDNDQISNIISYYTDTKAKTDFAAFEGENYYKHADNTRPNIQIENSKSEFKLTSKGKDELLNKINNEWNISLTENHGTENLTTDEVIKLVESQKGFIEKSQIEELQNLKKQSKPREYFDSKLGEIRNDTSSKKIVYDDISNEQIEQIKSNSIYGQLINDKPTFDSNLNSNQMKDLSQQRQGQLLKQTLDTIFEQEETIKNHSGNNNNAE